MEAITKITAAPAAFRRLPGNVQGGFLLLLDAFLVVVLASLVKNMGQSIHSFQILFLRAFFGLIFVAPTVFFFSPHSLRTEKPFFYVVRGSIATIAMFLWFYVLPHLPLSTALSISYSKRLFIVIFATLIFKEGLAPIRILAVTIGLCGVLVVLRPSYDGFIGIPAAFLLLYAIVEASGVIVVKAMTSTEGPLKNLFFFSIALTAFTIIPAMVFWQSLSPLEWFIGIIIGIVGSLGQLCFITACHVADISAISGVSYSGLILGIIAGYLFFGETLDIWIIVGSLMIIADAMLTARGEARTVREKNALDN